MFTTTRNKKTTEEKVTQPGGGPSNVAGVAGGASVAGSGRETRSKVTDQEADKSKTEGIIECRQLNLQKSKMA